MSKRQFRRMKRVYRIGIQRVLVRYTGATATLAPLLLVVGCGGTHTGEVTELPVNPIVPTPSTMSSGSSTGVEPSSPQPSSTVSAASSAAPVASAPPMAASEPRCPAEASLVAGGSYQRAGTKVAKALPDLCVDTLETTVSEYGQCVSAGACSTTGLDCSAQATWNKPGKEQQPIVCIEYDQAAAYCKHRGKRLPTIQEWEWVARSGTEARTYSWGSEPPDAQLCWTGKHRQTESCVVGTHPEDRSVHGVLDLTGNVLEFVTTERDAHSPLRIAKGGAWNGGDSALFTTTRLGGFRKEYRCGFLGVRCVQEAKATTAP